MRTNIPDEVLRFIPLAVTLSFFSIVGDGVIDTLYILKGQSNDGLSPSDLFIGVAFFSLWVLAISALMKLGLQVLPFASKEKRAKVIPIWSASMFLTGCVSSFMSTSYLGEHLAKQEYATHVVQSTNLSAEKIIEIQKTGNSLQNIFNAALASLKVLYETEKRSGTICETGPGEGRCTGLLQNLVETTQASLTLLIGLNGQAEPLIATIRELQSDIRWITNSQKNFDEKSVQLQEKMNAMAVHIDALKQTLPIMPLTRAIDSYSRNWASMSISAIGANRIQTEVRPIAERLRPILASLKAASHIEIERIEHKNEYELLASSVSVRPIIGISLLLAFLPMLISVCVLLLTGEQRDPPSRMKEIEHHDVIKSFPKDTQTKH